MFVFENLAHGIRTSAGWFSAYCTSSPFRIFQAAPPSHSRTFHQYLHQLTFCLVEAKEDNPGKGNDHQLQDFKTTTTIRMQRTQQAQDQYHHHLGSLQTTLLPAHGLVRFALLLMPA